MKLYPDKIKLTKAFLGAFACAAIILNLICIELFYFSTWTYVQPLIIGLFLVLSIVFYLMALKGFTYYVEKSQLVVCRLNREMYYPFQDVLYFDEEKSRSKKILIFVTSKGHFRYLICDKEQKIIDIFVQRCHCTVSLEEVRRRFPGLKV